LGSLVCAAEINPRARRYRDYPETLHAIKLLLASGSRLLIAGMFDAIAGIGAGKQLVVRD
jgi:hypothetical protein